MLLLLGEEDPVCHEDWYWLSRTFHSRRFFFMSRSLFEKNQKIILIKLVGLDCSLPTRRASTSTGPPLVVTRNHFIWGIVTKEWKNPSPACSSFELCTRSAMRLEKKWSFFWIQFQCSYSGKIGRKETFVMCSPFPQKVAENEGRNYSTKNCSFL